MLATTAAVCLLWLSVCEVDTVVVLVPPLAVMLPDVVDVVPIDDVWLPLLACPVGVMIDVPPCEFASDDIWFWFELPVEFDCGSLAVVSTGEEVDTADVVVPLLPTDAALTLQLIWLPAKLVVLNVVLFVVL